MRVQCPSCGSAGNLPDHKIPPQGVKITCPKCKTAFFVQKPEEPSAQEPSLFQMAQSQQTPHAREYCQEGLKLFKQRQIDAAIEKFNLALQVDPQYADAYRYLGAAYGQKNLWAEACQVLEKALTYQPDDVQALKNIGVAYLKQNRYADAERAFQQALQHAPADEKITAFLAQIASKTGAQGQQPPPASVSSKAKEPTLFEKTDDLVAPVPSIPTAPRPAAQRNDPRRELLDQGVEHLDNAQYNNAIEAFNEVIRLDPAKSDGYFGLGMVYEKRKEWEKASEAYAKAIEVNPDDHAAQEGLKFVKKQQKKFNWKFWQKSA